MFKTSFISEVTGVHTTDKEGVGTLRYDPYSQKWYKYVQYKQGDEGAYVGAAGDAVAYISMVANTVTNDVSAATDKVAAGVLLAAVTTDQFCWIQVGGESPVLTVDITDTPAVGTSVTISATNKAFRKAATDAIVPSAGVCLNATTATMKVYLTCPF